MIVPLLLLLALNTGSTLDQPRLRIEITGTAETALGRKAFTFGRPDLTICPVHNGRLLPNGSPDTCEHIAIGSREITIPLPPNTYSLCAMAPDYVPKCALLKMPEHNARFTMNLDLLPDKVEAPEAEEDKPGAK